MEKIREARKIKVKRKDAKILPDYAMDKQPLPTDILYADITADFWERDEAGPIVVGNKLRSYLRWAETLGHDDVAEQARRQLGRLKELVPNIDDLFRAYDEKMKIFKEEIRREIGR